MSYFDFLYYIFTNSEYTFLSYTIIALFGLIFWSFTTVFVSRVYKEETIFGSSYCPSCNSKIKWYDNIPLIGWLCLWWKCRTCKNKIPLFYPLTELIVSMLFLLSFFISKQMDLNLIQTISLMLMSVPIYWIFYTDYKDFVISDLHLYTFLVLSLAFLYNDWFIFQNLLYWIWMFGAFAILSYGSTFYLKFKNKQTFAKLSDKEKEKYGEEFFDTWMWLWDAWLVLPMWFVLWSLSLYALFIAVFLWAVIWLLKKAISWSTVIPFWPFLLIGFYITLIFWNNFSTELLYKYLQF